MVGATPSIRAHRITDRFHDRYGNHWRVNAHLTRVCLSSALGDVRDGSFHAPQLAERPQAGCGYSSVSEILCGNSRRAGSPRRNPARSRMGWPDIPGCAPVLDQRQAGLRLPQLPATPGKSRTALCLGIIYFAEIGHGPGVDWTVDHPALHSHRRLRHPDRLFGASDRMEWLQTNLQTGNRQH